MPSLIDQRPRARTIESVPAGAGATPSPSIGESMQQLRADNLQRARVVVADGDNLRGTATKGTQ